MDHRPAMATSGGAELQAAVGASLDSNTGGCTAKDTTVSSGSSTAAMQLLDEFLQVQAHRAAVYSQFNQGFRELLDHGQELVFARLMHQVTPAFNAASQQVINIESCLKAPPVNRPDLAALLRAIQEQERIKLKLTLSWQALRAAHAAGRFSWQDAADRPRTQGATAPAAGQQQQQQQQQLLALLEQMQLQSAGGSSTAAADRPDVAASDQGVAPELTSASVKPGFYEQQMQRAVSDAMAAVSKNQQQQHHHHRHHHACGHSGVAGGHSCHHSHHEAPDPLEPNSLEPTETDYTLAVREALQGLDACVAAINELLDDVRGALQELQVDCD